MERKAWYCTDGGGVQDKEKQKKRHRTKKRPIRTRRAKSKRAGRMLIKGYYPNS